MLKSVVVIKSALSWKIVFFSYIVFFLYRTMGTEDVFPALYLMPIFILSLAFGWVDVYFEYGIKSGYIILEKKIVFGKLFKFYRNYKSDMVSKVFIRLVEINGRGRHEDIRNFLLMLELGKRNVRVMSSLDKNDVEVVCKELETLLDISSSDQYQ